MGVPGSMRNKRNKIMESDGFGDHPVCHQHWLELRRKSSRRFYVFPCAVGYGNKLKSLFSVF